MTTLHGKSKTISNGNPRKSVNNGMFVHGATPNAGTQDLIATGAHKGKAHKPRAHALLYALPLHP